MEGTRVGRSIDPSDARDVVDECAQADAAPARDTVASVRAAFGTWRLAAPQQRLDILDAVGSEILARRAELADRLTHLLTRKERKTLPEAIGDVVRAGHIVEFFAGKAPRVGGDAVGSARPVRRSRASRSAWTT